MLTEICAELKNYFSKKEDRIFGDFAVESGQITPSFSAYQGQYYRIVGSVFNDGVHKYGDENDTLTDEGTFHGAIWLMRVPPEIISLAQDIADWQVKYGNVNSENMSPYQSESFGGYSYTKASGYVSSGANESTGSTWQKTFSARLKPYRRIRVV